MNFEACGLAWMRCAGLLAVFPQALGLNVPVTLRGIVAVALAVALAPAHAAAHGPMAPLAELLLGVAMGFCLRLPLWAFQAAGQAVGFTTSASMFLKQDLPEDEGGGGNIWSAAFVQVGVLLWFTVGGPEALIETIAGSLRIAAPGAPAGFGGTLDGLSALVVRSCALGAVLCLPPVLASLLVQWALGLVFRASARMQMHTFALPLASMAALGILVFTLPTWPTFARQALQSSLGAAAQVARASVGSAP